MTTTNDFLDFCNTDTGTNLLTQVEYTASTDRTSGNKSGVASSKLVNKALRQSSFVIANFAQWVSNKLNVDVLDNGSNSDILAKLYSSLAPNDSFALENVAFAVSVGTSALTVAVKTSAGTDPSATDVAYVSFRSATAATGIYVRRAITAALSITIPSTTTIGTASGVTTPIFIGFLDNAGAVELCLTVNPGFDEGSIVSSSAISGGSSSQTLYSTTSRSNVPFRYAGRFISTQATAGTWATTPSEVTGQRFRKSKLILVGTAQTASGTTSASTSFATPTNAPTITFTPLKTGYYKIWGTYPVENQQTGQTVGCKLTGVSGSPTILFAQESMGLTGLGAVAGAGSVSPYTIALLTAGTSYTFTLQLRNTSAGATNIRSDQTVAGTVVVAEEM